MAWTDEQLNAINLEGKNIIVSAGAGSGKTAVLTERVKRKLKDGIHINNLLVLTFTNAAAKEMKDRIRKTINNTEGLEKEANLLDGAYITTFDSFSLSVVKKYHTKLNITNKITISDQIMIDLKIKEILNSIFEENYSNPTESFINLINDFCLKDDEELKKYILNIYNKIELKYDKTKYLEDYFNIDNTAKYIDDYLALIRNKQNTIKQLISLLPNYFENEFILKVEDNFNKLVNASTYDEVLNALDYASLTVPRGSSIEAKKIKASIFEQAKEITELCIYSSTDEMYEEILSTKENTKVIVDILKELDKRVEEYKYNEEVFNFTDIARLAIKVVMENNDVKEELKNTFQEILVDEYQDTSDLQELFISLISKNNVYMVGDIKQSIYRFRNANPYIFKNKYDKYRDTDEGEKIDLLKNFRSRSEVLDNINLIFDMFMDDNFGGADYKKSHRMIFGNNKYIDRGNTGENYNLEVLSYDESNLGRISKSEEEAFIIGNDIKDKINNKYKVYDKDNDVIRDCNYNDFVILLDKSKDFDLYKKIFEYLQIPLNIVKEEELTKDDDILVIRNLLRLLICIKEERFDTEFIHSFISISRSYLYRISDEEIYEIYINNTYKETNLYKKCLEVVSNIDIMNLSSYLNYVLDKFNYEEHLLTTTNIKSFITRKEYLYNLCKTYEEAGNTIYDFVNYLNEVFENEYALKFNINDGNTNSCRIMTIHKSKGLEFPICYFAGFSSRFNLDELKDKIIYDNKYGIILPKVNEYYKDTILKTLVKKSTRFEEISERIRLLYVALTRAKEKMIMVIPKIEEEEETIEVLSYEKEKYISFYSIIKSIYSKLLTYNKEVELIANKEYQNNHNSNIDLVKQNIPLDTEEILIESNQIEEVHYSKESLHIPTKEEMDKMKFGTTVHSILEEIDFNDYNLDLYDIDASIKDKVNAFIKSEFMQDKLNLNMYKEYEFLYKEENTISHGIIDLLLEDIDKMIIVDYKLKNIDDPLYDKQLNGYRTYIETKTNKKTYCYLYSIIDERLREV